ncbi:quinoprotein dehydrogenase-associated putative ABC transporter substrate-binding protein [Steroidobacter sp. S1-65]|uniref:Quinoprotein dehydrogenase-associated putative ABC transporter substrate-binding protein n=1 Tax=Steroidobacter gossypii TaxID=2805490 RepID=A0ABS1WYT1_9GAMM|nr:quinoprotein dehydrogenase-associated putative ABC transporter substrate-binding protein [Steroidobacter gossypii]MBM0106126.1 quinoprotein dehydrogenase-associated putative ABC transporter substrate-binding protein [Steroidobacter gossypii]
MARSSLVASRRCNSVRLGASALICLLLSPGATPANQAESVLRVCADPDNMPLSNRRGEGYENKIAEALASDLGRRVEYTFFPQRMGFVRNTLRARDEKTKQFKCDVIIGVPKGYELTATTRPYMHSTYAMVFAQRPEFGDLRAADDLMKLPRNKLASLRIGVFARSPGADWLLRNGLMERAVMYAAQSGDPAENPAHTIEQDLAANKIDLAIVWGPIAGFLVERHSGDRQWQAVPFLPDPQIKFDYEIAMGVRFGERQWQGVLDAWIDQHQSTIDRILSSYRIPLLDASGQLKQTVPEKGT